MSINRLNVKDVEVIFEMLSKGSTIEEIAEKYQKAKKTIQNIVWKYKQKGFRYEPSLVIPDIIIKADIPEEVQRDVIYMYEKGYLVQKIVDKYNISPTSIRSILKFNGKALRRGDIPSSKDHKKKESEKTRFESLRETNKGELKGIKESDKLKMREIDTSKLRCVIIDSKGTKVFVKPTSKLTDEEIIKKFKKI